MAAQLIDGASIAAGIQAELRARVDRLRAQGVRPSLSVLVIGDNPASLSYVRAKTDACEGVGICCETVRLPSDLPQFELLELVAQRNRDSRVHGVLVQQPLPEHIDVSAVVQAVAPEKDVDGLHPFNMGLLLQGRPAFIPCTAAAVQELLLRSGHDPANKHVVIVGRSSLVGKPLAALLLRHGCGGDATVTVCHRQTPDLARITREADILVVAAGRPGLVTAEMVQPGAVVIDVGMNRVPDPSRRRGYRLVGDVEFESVSERAAAITPVPGGVGPMTVALLLANTVKAAEGLALPP
jgi:methylenetetrahydrofolate dehydrogenase (NADP+) / methenyltetrahydrofolate cyclohydrolase